MFFVQFKRTIKQQHPAFPVKQHCSTSDSTTIDNAAECVRLTSNHTQKMCLSMLGSLYALNHSRTVRIARRWAATKSWLICQHVRAYKHLSFDNSPACVTVHVRVFVSVCLSLCVFVTFIPHSDLDQDDVQSRCARRRLHTHPHPRPRIAHQISHRHCQKPRRPTSTSDSRVQPLRPALVPPSIPIPRPTANPFRLTCGLAAHIRTHIVGISYTSYVERARPAMRWHLHVRTSSSSCVCCCLITNASDPHLRWRIISIHCE